MDSAGQTRWGARYNLLFSNTETVKPVIYSRSPKAVVRRRYLDDDPVARQASEVLKRVLDFIIDDEDFDDQIGGAREALPTVSDRRPNPA